MIFNFSQFIISVVIRLLKVRKNVSQTPARISLLFPKIIIFLVSSSISHPISHWQNLYHQGPYLVVISVFCSEKYHLILLFHISQFSLVDIILKNIDGISVNKFSAPPASSINIFHDSFSLKRLVITAPADNYEIIFVK